jgi:hypothetical protein
MIIIFFPSAAAAMILHQRPTVQCPADPESDHLGGSIVPASGGWTFL